MKISRSLISCFAAINNDFRNDHLKLCFLWYDEIMIETLNEYGRINYANQILHDEELERKQIQIFTDIVTPLEERVSKGLLDNYRNSEDHTYPRWGENLEKFTYPSPQDAKQYAHNALLAHIQREWEFEEFDGAAIEQAEGRARVAINAVSLWETVQQEVPCMMEANYDERLAMASANIFNTKEKDPVEPFKLFETSAPSLVGVSWSEIIKLKINGNFDSLRDKLKEVVALTPNDLSAAQDELEKLEQEAIEDIIEKYRPNVKKVAIESVLANIPGIPLVNPAGAFFGVRDTIEEKNKATELSWFYLLRDVRNVAKK